MSIQNKHNKAVQKDYKDGHIDSGTYCYSKGLIVEVAEDYDKQIEALEELIIEVHALGHLPDHWLKEAKTILEGK